MEKVVKRYRLGQEPKDAMYWLSRPAVERLTAVELLRQLWLESHPDAIQGLQRVCRVTQRTPR